MKLSEIPFAGYAGGETAVLAADCPGGALRIWRFTGGEDDGLYEVRPCSDEWTRYNREADARIHILRLEPLEALALLRKHGARLPEEVGL